MGVGWEHGVHGGGAGVGAWGGGGGGGGAWGEVGLGRGMVGGVGMGALVLGLRWGPGWLGA